MDNGDPVSPKAYWLSISLILPEQPIRAAATVSDVGMKEEKEGGREKDGEIEVKVRGKNHGHVWCGEGREMESDKVGDEG